MQQRGAVERLQAFVASGDANLEPYARGTLINMRETVRAGARPPELWMPAPFEPSPDRTQPCCLLFLPLSPLSMCARCCLARVSLWQILRAAAERRKQRESHEGRGP